MAARRHGAWPTAPRTASHTRARESEHSRCETCRRRPGVNAHAWRGGRAQAIKARQRAQCRRDGAAELVIVEIPAKAGTRARSSRRAPPPSAAAAAGDACAGTRRARLRRPLLRASLCRAVRRPAQGWLLNIPFTRGCVAQADGRLTRVGRLYRARCMHTKSTAHPHCTCPRT